ncbi:putative leucine-rich repeat-containing protein DDB_G0290503 isoform X2 [Chironomus tepperi]|uniref:putative leucine-rich repeat-containing protein DDB_G0290503 isoform X2 n=1 Tax=Chironomus tepperi TaxID=113505 RepID=UPI00391FC88D
MDEPRESDLLEEQLVDFSAIDESSSSKLVHQSSLSKGFCVKEYEEQMDSLKKENFNLKLRLYFLEQNNTSLPEGIENFQKQFTDLKLENETLSNDVNEKQQLLQQASLALELLEEEKLNSQSCAELLIGELKDKVKYLEQENIKLHHALNDVNKSNLGNDTGYAEFLGAVDMRDIELQRKVLDMSQLSEEYKQQVNRMQKEIQKLNGMLKESESRAAAFKYERDEMQDKFENAESESKMLSIDLENELKDFKEKWASTQCELNDVEEKLKESEDERQKTLKYLTQCLQTLDENRQKISAMEIMIEKKQGSGIDTEETKKNAEINELKLQLEKVKQQLKEVTSSELEEKNQEIEKLSQIIRSMKNNENKNSSETPRFSFDYLYESFNDLKFQQAMEIKKQSQLKVNELMQELIGLANSKTKDQFNQLKEQMAIVVEKQEIADNALSRCAELCSYTLDHLHELAQFLSALLQNKEIRESLSNQSLKDIQNILDKSVEFSRYSIDGRISAFPDLSMLESLITTARDSISNIRQRNIEIVKNDETVQPTIDCKQECKSCENFKDQLQVFSEEFEELKKINQLLEDEIYEYREKLEFRDEEIKKCNDEIKSLIENEIKINVVLNDSQNTLRLLQAEKIDLSSKLDISEDLVQKLEKRMKDFEDDLEMNWMPKCDHEKYVKRVKDEVVNAEAQTAAIRFELEEIRKLYPKFKSNRTSLSIEDDQENKIEIGNQELAQSQDNCKSETRVSQVTAKTREFEDDKLHDLMSTETSSTISCRNCPKYKAQICELKKYLQVCCDKLKKHSDQKNYMERHVQKQLNKTENFLQQARSNMENIMKSKENLK